MDSEKAEVRAILQEHFKELPKPVQQAILSADVEKHLRELAEKHKLHLDQWISLENEVMMALLGIQSVEDLGQHISEEAEVSRELGEQIADDAFELIFEPVRQKMEQELHNPNNPGPVTPPKEVARQAAITQAKADEGSAASAPGTSPQAEQKGTSAKRSAIAGDPYREPIQ